MQILEHSIKSVGKSLFMAALLLACATAYAQTPKDTTGTATGRGGGNVQVIPADSNAVASDTSAINGKKKKPKHDFRYHSPVKATWMSAALPSLGQFYNKRYWKPPIIYAGLGVAIYFLIDNQLKFVIARNSYRAREGVPGFTVHQKYASYSADQILSDRDFYRTNRDYSIIAVAGIYALNIIDAAVDAHLRTFDVGDDLSMKIRPSFRYTSNVYQTGFAPMPGIAWTLRF